jgi:hypothetical protein
MCSSGRPFSKSWKMIEPDELSENILPLLISRTIPPSAVWTLRGRGDCADMKACPGAAMICRVCAGQIAKRRRQFPETRANVREREVHSEKGRREAIMVRCREFAARVPVRPCEVPLKDAPGQSRNDTSARQFRIGRNSQTTHYRHNLAKDFGVNPISQSEEISRHGRARPNNQSSILEAASGAQAVSVSKFENVEGLRPHW